MSKYFSHDAILVPEGGLYRNDDEARFDLGQLVHDGRGNFFRYVKANEALAVGQAVTSVPKAAWDATIVIDGALAAAGVSTIHVDTITTARAAGYYEGKWISQATAAGLGMGYKIQNHGAMAAAGEVDIIIEGVTQETFADGAVLYIFDPYLVELTDAAAETIQGIAVGTITSGYYGFVQVAGHFRAVRVGHSTSAAIVLDEPLVPLAAVPGSLQGMAGGDEADIMEAANSGLLTLQAVAANTLGYVEAFSKGIL